MRDVETSSPLPTIGQVRRELAMAFRRSSQSLIETPALDARLILSHVCDFDPSELPLHDDMQLGSAEIAHAQALAARRFSGEPVARLIGHREFWGLRFAVSGATLVPRPDSETIISAVLDGLGSRRSGALRVLDLGTGSGCLLAALLTEFPDATGVGIDLSEEAIKTASDNARSLGLGERARFLAGNWADAIGGQFDVIISNPPYIAGPEIAGLPPEVRDHDPALALDGGVDGLAAHRAILSELPRLLRPDGVACVEAGAGQASDFEELANATGLSVEVRADLAGHPRAFLLTIKADASVTAGKNHLEIRTGASRV